MYCGMCSELAVTHLVEHQQQVNSPAIHSQEANNACLVPRPPLQDLRLLYLGYLFLFMLKKDNNIESTTYVGRLAIIEYF